MRLYAAAAFVATTLLSSKSNANDEGRNVQLRGVGDGGPGGDSGGRFPAPAATASSESLDSPSRNLRKMTGSCTLLEKEVQCLGLDGNGGPCPSITDEEESTGRGTGRGRRFACEMPCGMIYDIEGLDDKVDVGGVGPILSGEMELEGDIDIDERAAKMLVRAGKLKTKRKRNGNGRKLAVTGPKTVLAIKVVAENGNITTSYDATELRDSIFGTSGDPVNLKSQMSACSDGEFEVLPEDLYSDDGVITVTVSSAVYPGGDRAMVNEVDAALLEAFGAHPAEMANHVMYCLPPGTMSGIAYAYINHWLSVYDDKWCTYVSAQMHYIGRNLGLANSYGENSTHFSQSGMMGSSYSESNTKMCFNAAKSWQLGWYSTKRETYINYLGTKTYELYGIVNANDIMAGTVLIKIESSTMTDLVINFNLQSLHNNSTKEGGNQVMIVEQGANVEGYAYSFVKATLDSGGFYTSKNYAAWGRDLVVSVEAINLNPTAGPAYATVTIKGVPDACYTKADCPFYCDGYDACVSGICKEPVEGECCGNNVCDANETASSCPHDCATEYMLACGSSNMPCANQTTVANVDEGHEVRCCSDQNLTGWSKHRGCEVSMGYEVWSQSVLDGPREGCYDNETHASATTICENAGGRLCTVAELLADCTRKSGCNHNRDMIWSSDYVEEAWQ